jgi:hypothetical protein
MSCIVLQVKYPAPQQQSSSNMLNISLRESPTPPFAACLLLEAAADFLEAELSAI